MQIQVVTTLIILQNPVKQLAWYSVKNHKLPQVLLNEELMERSHEHCHWISVISHSKLEIQNAAKRYSRVVL
jgi:hypothetical protein